MRLFRTNLHDYVSCIKLKNVLREIDTSVHKGITLTVTFEKISHEPIGGGGGGGGVKNEILTGAPCLCAFDRYIFLLL